MRRLCTAAILLAAYAIPLFFPPPAQPPAAPPLDASLWVRLFPGIPPLWVLVRLICLAGGAILVASVARSPFASAASPPPRTEPGDPPPGRWPALGIAFLLAVAGVFVTDWGQDAQMAHVALLFLPGVLLSVPRKRPFHWSFPRAWLIASLGIIGVWILIRSLTDLGSTRAADPVDTWVGLFHLESATRNDLDLFRERFLPGVPLTYLVLQGLPFLSAGDTGPSLGWIQSAHLLWVAIGAFMTALLARRLIGGSAAPVAVAALLFSPFVLAIPLQTTPFFLGIVFAPALLLLFLGVHRQRSDAALVTLAAVGGITATMPPIVPLTLATGLAALWSLWLRPRFSSRALLTAAACFVAISLPSLPDWQSAASTAAWYTEAAQQWSLMEAVGLGQLPPFWIEIARNIGERGALDLPVASLLAPFATPRTPIRLMGDSFLDPLSGVLAAIGLATALRYAPQARRARGLLLVLGLSLLPGCFLSVYDRLSIPRLFVAPVPLALLAALGLKSLQGHLGRRGRHATAALVVATIAAAGSILFDLVNPRILARSWLGVTIDSLRHGPPLGRVILFEPGGAHPYPGLRTHPIATHVPRRPITVLPYDGDATLELVDPAAGGADLLAWSPGHNEAARISESACERWPGARHYTLADDAGVSRAIALLPAGQLWQPSLSPDQWQSRSCSELRLQSANRNEAAERRASEAMRQARARLAEGSTRAALYSLRQAARDTAWHSQLFEMLARVLLERNRDHHDREEALVWAQRACRVTNYREIAPLMLLARAYRALGDEERALAFGARALAIAQERGDTTAEKKIRERFGSRLSAP